MRYVVFTVNSSQHQEITEVESQMSQLCSLSNENKLN